MPKTSLRYSDYLPIKLADVSWPGLKDDANQVAFPCVFFVIFHFFGLLKGLLVGHLELKQKGSPIGLQRQVNSPLVVPPFELFHIHTFENSQVISSTGSQELTKRLT